MELPKKFEQVDQWKTMIFLYESALKEMPHPVLQKLSAVSEVTGPCTKPKGVTT